MGKGGAGKGKNKATEDDDSLLNAAIAENRAIAEKAQAATEAAALADVQPSALSGDDIVKKLNAVPCFCILNGADTIVGLKDPNDAMDQNEVCCWFCDAAEAKLTLAQVKAANPEIAASLHIGVTPLGIAFAFASGWADCHFFGEKQVRGASEALAGGQDMVPMLRDQALQQGLEAQSWNVPVFSCDELQSPTVMPLFLSRKALAEAWVTSGRKLADIPANLAVMDLGVVVHQMQQPDTFAWSTVQFVAERRAVQLVQEAGAAAATARSAPPPLE